MEAKNSGKLEARAKANTDREKTISNEWLAFSKTSAYKDLMEYGNSTKELLTEYAREGVMPSPLADGEQVAISGEKALFLLQNSRGCDIILSYIEQYVLNATSK